MLRYAIARVVWTIPVVFVAVTLTFFLVRSIGGDPFRHGPLVGLTTQGQWQKYGDFQPKSIRDNMRRRYSLDLPWYEQYGSYLVGVTTLSLGPSLVPEPDGRRDHRRAGTGGRSSWPCSRSPFHSSSASRSAQRAPCTPLPLRATRTPRLVACALAPRLPGRHDLIYLFAVRAGLVPTTGWDAHGRRSSPSAPSASSRSPTACA